MAQVPAFLNDAYMSLEACRISPLDRGFIFGDGVYELIPVYGRKAFCLQQHLVRLARSIEQVRMHNPYTQSQWEDMVENLIQQAISPDLAVYIQVTRGVATRDHGFPESTSPTVFAMANPLMEIPNEQLQKGVALVTVDDIRWQRCDIKVVDLLPNILAKQDALQAGAAEAIMVRDGFALEGSSSNLFVIRKGEVYTHPKDNLILPGITREIILELLGALGLKFHEQAIPENWLYLADELWITSSAREILAATTIDHHTVGDGVPGKLWKDVYALYQQRKVGD